MLLNFPFSLTRLILTWIFPFSALVSYFVFLDILCFFPFHLSSVCCLSFSLLRRSFSFTCFFLLITFPFAFLRYILNCSSAFSLFLPFSIIPSLNTFRFLYYLNLVFCAFPVMTNLTRFLFVIIIIVFYH